MLECFGSAAKLLRPKKKATTENLSAITIGYLLTNNDDSDHKYWKRLRILFDSGCGATLVNKHAIKGLNTTKDKLTK